VPRHFAASCGHALALVRQQEGIRPEQQAANLGNDLARLAQLCACVIPERKDLAAIEAIADQAGVSVGQLANLLGVV
jgi:hypothetical protein